jgi:hypothetical protein
VDVIVYRKVKRDTHVLLGYRKIDAYGDRWALIFSAMILRKEILLT